MITKLSIANFKSVRQLNIDCKKVNLFIGEPSCLTYARMPIRIAYFRNYETLVKPLTPEELSELMEAEPFFNLDRFIEELTTRDRKGVGLLRRWVHHE